MGALVSHPPTIPFCSKGLNLHAEINILFSFLLHLIFISILAILVKVMIALPDFLTTLLEALRGIHL
jgi:hypothetical protein